MFFIHNSFVLEKVLEKEQKIKPYTTKWLYINGRGRRTWSRLPARSVLLHFVQRSPPETRTPQHAPRASESKSFYSMPKQKRSPFGNRFRFGRGRRTWTLGTRFWSGCWSLQKVDCNAIFKSFLHSCQNTKIILMLYWCYWKITTWIIDYGYMTYNIMGIPWKASYCSKFAMQ